MLTTNAISPMWKSLIILLCCFCVSFGAVGAEKSLIVSDREELQFLFAKPLEEVIVHLQPGEYHLSPTTMIDSSCGNCRES